MSDADPLAVACPTCGNAAGDGCQWTGTGTDRTPCPERVEAAATIAVVSPSGSIRVRVAGVEHPVGYLDADATPWESDADAQLLYAGWKRTEEWDGDWAPIERVAAQKPKAG